MIFCRFLIFCSLLVLLFALPQEDLEALYNQKFRYSFHPFHQFYGGMGQDDFSFKFTDARDDFRSMSLLFTYLAPQWSPISVEFSYHILTFRGVKTTPEEDRGRTTQLDLTILYHFFLPSQLGMFRIKAGGRFCVYGNFLAAHIQEAAHWIFVFKRKTSLQEDPYFFLFYGSIGGEYHWHETFFVRADLQLSFVGDYFVRTGLGLLMRNEFMEMELTLYAQQAQQRGQEIYRVADCTIKNENGWGLFWRTETDHSFAFLDLIVNNWSPIYTGGQFYGKFFSVLGLGFKFTSSDPLRESKESKEKESSLPPATRPLTLLSSRLGMRFGVEVPSRYVHAFVWVPRDHLPLALVAGFCFQYNTLANRLFTHVSWDAYEIAFFGLYFEAGISLSLGQWSEFSSHVWNTPIKGYSFSCELEGKGGVWFKVWKGVASEYRLLLNTGFTYYPFFLAPLNTKREKLKVFHFLDYHWVGLLLEVRPRSTRGKKPAVSSLNGA